MEPYHEAPSRSDFGGGTSYDANGNRTSVVYPGGVTATYEFDFADRETSLSVKTSADQWPRVPPISPTAP